MPRLQPKAYLIFTASVLAQLRPNEHQKFKKKTRRAVLVVRKGRCGAGVIVFHCTNQLSFVIHWNLPPSAAMAALSSAIASAAKPFPRPLQHRLRRHVRGHRRRVCVNGIFVGRRGWRDRKGSCGDGPHRSDGGGRQQRRRNAALERRRCARWWELCVGGVLDGGSCAGRWRWSLEKMKADRRWWSSQRNRRRCRCTMKKLGFFNPTNGYCLGYSKLRHIVPLLPRVGVWPRPIVSLLPRLLENRGILLQ